MPGQNIMHILIGVKPGNKGLMLKKITFERILLRAGDCILTSCGFSKKIMRLEKG
jgi:hypothetical protein